MVKKKIQKKTLEMELRALEKVGTQLCKVRVLHGQQYMVYLSKVVDKDGCDDKWYGILNLGARV